MKKQNWRSDLARERQPFRKFSENSPSKLTICLDFFKESCRLVVPGFGFFLQLLAIEKWGSVGPMGPRQLVRTKVRFAESLQSQGCPRGVDVLPVGEGVVLFGCCGVYGQMI